MPDCPPDYACTVIMKPPDVGSSYQWDPVMLFAIIAVVVVTLAILFVLVSLSDNKVKLADKELAIAEQRRHEAQFKEYKPPRRGRSLEP